MSSKIQLIAQSKNKAGGAKNFELTAGMGDGGQAIRVQAESGVRYELLDLATRQGPLARFAFSLLGVAALALLTHLVGMAVRTSIDRRLRQIGPLGGEELRPHGPPLVMHRVRVAGATGLTAMAVGLPRVEFEGSAVHGTAPPCTRETRLDLRNGKGRGEPWVKLRRQRVGECPQ